MLVDLKNNYKLYHGYQVYPNGTVVSPGGKKIKKYSLQYIDSHVYLYIDGKYKRKKLISIMYECFKDDFDKDKIVWFKDGNKKHVYIDNLIQMDKREYMLKVWNASNYNRILSENDIKAIEQEYNSLHKRYSATSSFEIIANMRGISKSTVRKVILGIY